MLGERVCCPMLAALLALVAASTPTLAAPNDPSLLLVQLQAARTLTRPEAAHDVHESVKYGYETLRYRLRANGPSALYARARRAEAPRVLFTHLLKAGGTSVQELMEQVFVIDKHYEKQSLGARPRKDALEDFLDELPENNPPKLNQVATETLTGDVARTHAGYFRIGNVRSPCDYLLSMWAFQSKDYGDTGTGHGKYPRQCLTKTVPDAESTLYGQDSVVGFASEDDVARFRKWVRAASGKRLHYMGLRSFFALHHDSVSYPTWDDGQFYGCMADLNTTEEERIAHELASAKLSERYECLIHTESIEDDFRACLVKYADALPHNMKADFLARVNAIKWNEGNSNPSKHGKCSYYFDKDTEDFVWERERAFATKAGYNTCCAVAS